ncbi:MAG: carbon-nitrogen hydrolase family protein [Chloroflexi bacterium]|nr:MAG: carbon-nitrogen hydrolase family protein [Chloroflexota bacterium]
MSDRIKVAVVQMDPKLMQVKQNLESIAGAVRKAADNQANLIVFPECSLTGYVFSSLQEALPFAEPIPGPSTEKIISLCQELKVYVVFGLLEKEGDKLFNALAFVGPQGLIAGYRKNHLPFLGIDRFVTKGNRPFQVHSTPIGNIGLHICYDVLFPESARIMTLLGADIIVLSTNFPEGRGETLNCVIRARAIENKVHLISADRVGTERGFSFAGMSNIVDATGEVLSLASPDKEEIIYGEVSLDAARQKHRIFIPGQWEIDNINDRRPEIYSLITQRK